MTAVRRSELIVSPMKIGHFALRIAASGVIAYAMAYRSVAFAGSTESDPNRGRLAPSVSSAPERDSCAQGEASARCLNVIVDHLRTVQLAQPVRTVLIGNPAIAEVNMISETQAVVSARTVGSTNLLFLNDAGDPIGDFEILVREGEQRRVVLRRGPTGAEIYQCAPRCERTLTQIDSAASHQAVSENIARETSVNAAAASAGGGTSE